VRRRLWRIVAVLAAVLLVAGVAVTAWQIFDPLAGERQAALQQQLQQEWAKPAAAVPSGTQGKLSLTAVKPVLCTDKPALHPALSQPFALMTIPAFGKGWKFAVVEGTTLTQLALGPGHITDTPFPGQQGNVGIAAHDVTAGNPFLHLVDLKPGNTVVITTRDCVTTYRVYRPSYTVLYTDIGVLKPVKREHTLTLITCTPVGVLYFVTHRTIVQAVEVSSVVRR
jgi:sortase A